MPTLGYPLDLTGAAPTNLVVNETHTFTTPDTRVFVPSGGPFYSSTVILRHGITNAVLLPNTDYKLLHLHRDGTIASGKQVCAVVYIHNLNIPSVVMQYQIIGSTYADTADSIRDLLSGTPPLEPSIAWGHVFGTPVQFAPAEHLHHADEVYGMQEVVSALEQMRVAILSGDSFAFDAIYQYISNLFTSQDWATQQQLTDAIAAATVNPCGTVRSYRTFAELRAETDIVNDASTIYICAGRASLLDGQGRSFVWAKNSTAVDNDETVLRPDILTVSEPGRMQTAMRIEFDVRNLARTLGRRIGTTGAIESDLSTVSPLGSISLNTLVTPGVYWVSSAVTNRPADVDSGVIVVERSHINNVIQTLYVHTSNVAPPDDDTSRTNVVIQHRSGSRNVETDAMDWTTWESTFSRTRATVSGIDTELALTRTTSADLNGLTRSAMFWVTSTAANNPFLGSPCVLHVQCLSDAVTMQCATTVEYEAYRRGTGGNNYTGHEWDGWVYRANRNGDVAQVFNVDTLPLGDENLEPSHAVNAGFLATQLTTLWTRLTANGIDADLATTNTLTVADLNAAITPGEYYYGGTNTNTPTESGLLTVRRESPTIIYQLAHSTGQGGSPENTLFTRTGAFYDDVWHWSDWQRYATTGELSVAIAALWTRLTANGIDADLATTNSLADGDLNIVIAPGEYYYDESTDNAPSSYGLLTVRRESPTAIYQMAQTAGLGATPENTLFTRYGSYWDDTWHWSAWNRDTSVSELTALQLRLTANGIDADLATTNVIPDLTDLNAVIAVGKYYYNTSANNPFPSALLEVEAFSNSKIIQTAYDAHRRAVRETLDSGATWSPWVFSEQAELSVTSHYGNTSGSLNDCTKNGRHWFDDDNEETPFINGWVEVVNIGGLGNAVHQVAYSSDGTGMATRRRLDGTWSTWMYSLDTVTAKRFGIDVDLAGVLNLIGPGMSLNSYGRGGRYWIHTGVGEAPLDHLTGLSIEHAVFVVDQLTSADCIQTVYKLGQISRRRGQWGTNYTGHTWTEWLTEVTHKDLTETYNAAINFATAIHTDTANTFQEAGIGVELAETNFTEDDFNTFTHTSKWYTGATNPNRPFAHAILEVTSLNISHCLQVAYNRNIRATRYGHNDVSQADHVWTDWVFSEQRELSITSHYGNTSGSLNDCTKNGRYWFDNRNTVTPFDHGWVEVVNIGGLGVGVHQVAVSGNGTGMATRRRLDGVWSGWVLIPDTAAEAVVAADLWVHLTRAGVNADLAVTNTLTVADLNAAITPGEYYYGIANTNTPSTYGLLTVRRENANIIYQLAHTAGIEVAPQNTLFTRYGSYYDSAWHWSAWNRHATTSDLSVAIATLWTELTRAGVNADLATTNSLANTNLNAAITPGEYYYTSTTANRPSNWGLLTVRRENANIIYQLAHSTGVGAVPENTLFTRYGTYYDGAWHWGAWNQYVTKTELDALVATVASLSTAVDALVAAANVRTITISASMNDLNLRTYQETLYGSPAPANCRVEYIIQSGVLISSSSTATYAITNPDEFAAGVIVTLTIQAGAAVSGRGGDGGRGGASWSEWYDANGDTFKTYIGGNAADPNNYVHGKHGGNAIRTSRALVINNQGFISVGSGGGGATAGVESGFDSPVAIKRFNLSGNGGGGGWPYGAGGAPGRIIESDVSQADYNVTRGDGWVIRMTSGNPGSSAGGLPDYQTTALGGAYIEKSISTGGFWNARHFPGGSGGVVYLTQYSDGGGSSGWQGNDAYGTTGDSGNGGNEGDYAINSSGGSITFVGAQGTIFGTVA